MPDVSVQISYHRQSSSTGRIRGGRIHLRISSLVSRREQERHIDELTQRMLPLLERERVKKIPVTLEPILQELLHGSAELLLSTGVEYHLQLRKVDQLKCKVQKVGNTLAILIPVSWREMDLGSMEEALWKFLMKDQVAVLKDRLNELRQGWVAEGFRIVKMKQVMSRWGSCDQKRGIIMLSVKLLLVEPKLLDYVCVHELAHLKYADHSDLFWDLVSEKMPDWKVQRRKLRRYE